MQGVRVVDTGCPGSLACNDGTSSLAGWLAAGWLAHVSSSARESSFTSHDCPLPTFWNDNLKLDSPLPLPRPQSGVSQTEITA